MSAIYVSPDNPVCGNAFPVKSVQQAPFQRQNMTATARCELICHSSRFATFIAVDLCHAHVAKQREHAN